MPQFTCNICGKRNSYSGTLEREHPACPGCRSNMRVRGLLYVLSMEMFGVAMILPDFPQLKSIRGVGTSDITACAIRLAGKFDYRNTFYDREPRLDIVNPPAEESGRYHFITSSEVFEHVLPPVERAFECAYELLGPSGLLVLTVPYSIETSTAEHYPDLHEFGFAEVGSHVVLVNRTRSGELQVFENPVFHLGVGGKALEAREFSERDLRQAILAAGFSSMQIYAENYPPFGIVHSESWSLPMVARKGEWQFKADTIREMASEWRDAKVALWTRLGRKLRVY